MKTGLLALGIASAVGATAQAHPLDAMIQRDATQESRLAADISHDKIDVHNAALLARQESNLHRLEAREISGIATLDPNALSQVRQSENDMAGALRWAETHRAKHAGRPSDRMHLRVATMREAEQQRWIARELKQDRLTPSEASELEAAQARIAQAQFRAVSPGHESVQTALSIQDRQDLQDYAIRKDPSVS